MVHKEKAVAMKGENIYVGNSTSDATADYRFVVSPSTLIIMRLGGLN